MGGHDDASYGDHMDVPVVFRFQVVVEIISVEEGNYKQQVMRRKEVSVAVRKYLWEFSQLCMLYISHVKNKTKHTQTIIKKSSNA
eukprot:3014090-Ditylum_brightwellii.AAC.1